MYKVLFVHKDFPGQFLHLARHLAAMPGVRVDAMASDPVQEVEGVTLHRYTMHMGGESSTHAYLVRTERAMWQGQSALAACVLLARTGYRPDLVIGHCGWGEILFIKDLWPDVPMIGYFEFYYRGSGADVGFDPPVPVSLNERARVRSLNLVNLLGLEAADRGVCPTRWQRDLHPPEFQNKLTLLHEGIDTDAASPGPARPLVLADGSTLLPGQEIVTYVARDLEPYRGFHIMMRAAAELLRARPGLHLAIAGGDGTSYGPPPDDGSTWRDRLLTELGDALPRDRVHFLGHVPHSDFINLMRLSSAHLYLTYPFVLSWSMLEAMACGVTLVASDTGPVVEVVEHGVNGLLVPFHDPAAVAAGLMMALDMPSGRRADLRKAARQTVIDRFDLARSGVPGWLRMLHDDFGLPHP
ncbi:glycosyltransferase family 4 protein [Niveispirillum sp.]|uniref:glycosyltransferase family 4 protein n=1 Tax=Niveispirillum sp. TaxID=1917217 RepID=UPI001B6ABF92|nr:glycosyltransferase family 4 protein [Niveispirillum sp.]MBP7334721.1 glycosyltransferase family 4 protein [Niveispirillum sp.]